MRGRQQKQPPNKISPSKGLALVIDEEVTQRDEGTFYLLPSEMSKSGLLNPERFDSCDIRNVNVDDIRPSALLGILSSLKPNAKVSITLCEPIAVMQPYEAKMIEANAKLAGFVDIETSPTKYFNKFSKKQDDTLKVTFTKPEKPTF